MFDRMFSSAGHKTFGAKAVEVLATVTMMWFAMLLVVSFFQAVGLVSVDFRTNTPLLGAGVNYWIQSRSLTLGQVLTSPFDVMILLMIMFGAPLLEEPLFRSLPLSLASDSNGDLKPRWGGICSNSLSVHFVRPSSWPWLLFYPVAGRWWFVPCSALVTQWPECIGSHPFHHGRAQFV